MSASLRTAFLDRLCDRLSIALPCLGGRCQAGQLCKNCSLRVDTVVTLRGCSSDRQHLQQRVDLAEDAALKVYEYLGMKNSPLTSNERRIVDLVTPVYEVAAREQDGGVDGEEVHPWAT